MTNKDAILRIVQGGKFIAKFNFSDTSNVAIKLLLLGYTFTSYGKR